MDFPHATVTVVTSTVQDRLGKVSTQAIYDVLEACVGAGLVRRIEPCRQISITFSAALARNAVGAIPADLHLINAEPPSDEDVERGKDAAEAAMMDEFAETMFGDPDELWYKCTGRLSVRNFDKSIPGRILSTTIVGRTRVNMLQMDTRSFGATATARQK